MDVGIFAPGFAGDLSGFAGFKIQPVSEHKVQGWFCKRLMLEYVQFFTLFNLYPSIDRFALKWRLMQ
jgi:hypothetical protein